MTERDFGNWGKSPDALVELIRRLAFGECATTPDWCLTHRTKADFGHYLDTRPPEDKGHNPRTGMAYDD